MARRQELKKLALGTKYEPQYAFGKMYWVGGGDTVYGMYFSSFFQRTYEGAARVAKDFLILTAPVRKWRYQADKEMKGDALGWARPDFDDRAWKITDTCIETWSSIGYHNYMDAMWYRTKVTLPEIPAGRKVFLWIGATDGSARVFVNGKHTPYVDAEGNRRDQFNGYASPASFDITEPVRPGAENQVTILCDRTGFNELGTGGILSAPVVIYREKD